MNNRIPAMQLLFLLTAFVSAAGCMNLLNAETSEAVWADVPDGMTQCIKCIRHSVNTLKLKVE